MSDESRDEEISLFELWEVIWSRKILIILITAVITGLGLMGVKAYNAKKSPVSTIIELTFDGISNNRYPDGSIFKKESFTTPEIVSLTLEKLGIKDHNVDQIRSSITADSIIPEKIVEITKKKLEDSEIYEYVPSQYVLKMRPTGANLSRDECKAFLEELVVQYNEDFYRKYSEEGLATNIIKNINFADYDYPDMAEILNNQVSMLIKYLNAKSAQHPEFRSLVTGYTFSDLASTVSVVKNVDLDAMNSLINTTNLTKNKNLLVLKYQYRIKQNELQIQKLDEESKISKQTMVQFQDTKKSSILIPGITNNFTEVQTENQNTYYESLADRVTNTGVNAASLGYDNEYITNRIEALENDKVSDDVKAKAATQVMGIIDSVTKQLDEWLDKSNATVIDQFSVLFRPAADVLAKPQIRDVIPVKTATGACVGVGLLLSIFVVFAQNGYKNYKKTKA